MQRTRFLAFALLTLLLAPHLRAAPETFDQSGWVGVRWTAQDGSQRSVARHESGALGLGFQGLDGGGGWGAVSADGTKAVRFGQDAAGNRGGLAVDFESRRALGAAAGEERQRVRWVDAEGQRTAVGFRGPAAGGREGWRAVGPNGAVHAERRTNREGVAWADLRTGERGHRSRGR